MDAPPDAPSPLLSLPVEVWDRVLFWMSLLPIDVANFAKACRRCHFLALGPVGDRNKYNVTQHWALGPPLEVLEPDAILMYALRLNDRELARRHLDLRYLKWLYQKIVLSSSRVSMRLLKTAIRWFDENECINISALDGLKAYCHLPLEINPRRHFQDHQYFLKGAAAGNNIEVILRLVPTSYMFSTNRTVRDCVYLACRHGSSEAFIFLLDLCVRLDISVTLYVDDLGKVLSPERFDVVECILRAMSSTICKYSVKSALLIALVHWLRYQEEGMLERALAIIGKSSELKVLFWNTAQEYRSLDMYTCGTKAGFALGLDQMKSALDLANSEGRVSLLADLIFRAKLGTSARRIAVWYASEILEANATDSLPRLLDGMLSDSHSGADFDLMVFGEVMNRLYGGQTRSDPERARPILRAFRPYLPPDEPEGSEK